MYQKRNDIIILDHIPIVIDKRNPFDYKEDKALKSINDWLTSSYKEEKERDLLKKYLNNQNLYIEYKKY
jgi:hypothetical protein